MDRGRRRKKKKKEPTKTLQADRAFSEAHYLRSPHCGYTSPSTFLCKVGKPVYIISGDARKMLVAMPSFTAAAKTKEKKDKQDIRGIKLVWNVSFPKQPLRKGKRALHKVRQVSTQFLCVSKLPNTTHAARTKICLTCVPSTTTGQACLI